MMLFWKPLSLLAITLASLISAPAPASAYQIDCAILLCLAGGFPPSAPCAAARAEMIRRITPWPIEPPLQLWRCPMRAEFSMSEPREKNVIDVMFAPLPSQGPNPEPGQVVQLWRSFGEDVVDYVMAIRVYDLIYRRHRNRDGDCIVSSSLRMGTYDRSWDYHWGQVALNNSPDWFFDTHYTNCSSVWFRGVGMEWREHDGKIGTEVVKY